MGVRPSDVVHLIGGVRGAFGFLFWWDRLVTPILTCICFHFSTDGKYVGPNLVHHFLIIKSRLILDLTWRQTQFFVLEFEDSESMWTIVTSLRSSLSADVFLLAMMVLWKSWELRNMEVQNSPNDVSPRYCLMVQ